MSRLFLLAAVALFALRCGPGSAEIRCGANECAENQRCEATQRICVLDEPPTVVVNAPLAGEVVPGDTLALKGTVEDDEGLATLELSTDQGRSWVKVPLSGTRFEARVALPTMDYEQLTLSLRALDSRQQARTTQVSVMVDNVAPVVVVASPLAGARLNLAWFANSPQLSGSATDGSGAPALTIDVGDGAGDRRVPSSGGPFSFTWLPPSGQDGVVQHLKVTAVDLAGNRTQVERAVTVDVVPPRVAFITPASGALLGTAFFEGGGRLQGTVSPGAKVSAAFAGHSLGATVEGDRWSVAFPAPVGMDYQQQVLEVEAVDEAGNQARALVAVTVDTVPPVLTFSFPAPNAKLNAANFSSGDEVAVGWSVSDCDPQVVTRHAGVALTASPLLITTSPTDNPKTYAVKLTAEDRAGNSSTADLSFAVDRVRPTVVSQAPEHSSRNNAPTVTIDFSEAVGGGEGVTLAPPVSGGSWTSPTHFELRGLPADAVFSAVVGAVEDAFGNPVVPTASTRFHTAPALPTSGAVLMNEVWHFKVAADPDGVVALFTTSQTTPAAYRWVRTNPRTGFIEDNRFPWAPTLGSGFTELDAYAWSTANPDLSSRRVMGAMTIHPGLITERRAWARLDDAAASNELGMVGMIPTGPFSAEGNLADVGYAKFSGNATSYLRDGMTSALAVGLGSPTGIGYATPRWEMIEVRNQTFKRRSYGCVTHFANSPPSCEFTPLAQWADVALTDNTSFAVSDSCSVYAYDTSAGSRVMRVEPYAPACLGLNCPLGWSAPPTPLADQLRVASDRRDTNTFIGARRVVGGVQLMRLALSNRCAGAWTSVGPPIAVGADSAFEPVSLGGKAALIYVDAGFVLKVYAP